jgi:predicted RNase H-like nuclease (RuvC/YqgF family)
MKDLLSYLIPVILFILGWINGRRKSKAESELLEMQTTEKAVAIWRQLAQDLKTEVAELHSLVEELKEENGKLKYEIHKLKQSLQ